ncbi:cupin domain-containing protein [Psychromonas aquimarina]|uniref:cupin domain-containing protein n=1 Tax=Psychromonas aquimarina TaxID=444919 RepID=UPI0004266D55|nr:cupin domain-containing protein [Psychromonas aquimarina]
MLKLLSTALLFTSLSVSAATSVDLVKSTTSWDGTSLPAYTLTQPEVTIKEIVIAPGEKLPMHQHPAINAGVLLSGTLTVYSGDKVLNMQAGDSLVELVNTSHYGENTGTEAAKIIVFYISEKGHAVTVIDK